MTDPDFTTTPSGWRGFAIAMVLLVMVLGTAAWIGVRASGGGLP